MHMNNMEQISQWSINAEGTQGVCIDVIACQAEVLDAALGSVLATSILAFLQNLDVCKRMRQVYSSLSIMNW